MKLLCCAVGSILLLFGALPVFADEPATTGTAKSLAAAEIAFARESVAKGMRTAFLNALSAEGVVFSPGPQNGQKTWQAKPESKSVLDWQPILAAVSTQGDLGYTTGPWTLKNAASDPAPSSFGQFVSVWRWENGKWKLLFDLGSDNPPPTGATPDLQLIVNHAPNESAADAQPVMLNHDRRYAADRAAQLAASAEENVRLYQPDKFPVVGKAEATAGLQEDKIKFGEAKTQVSQSGDLGYVWGEYSTAPGTKVGGDYLRIWRKDRVGEWKLALDLVRTR